MTSNCEETNLTPRKVEVLLQVKESAKKLEVRDQGFGFYYPNAVQVNRKKLQLIRREAEPDFERCNIERMTYDHKSVETIS
jgi:signal transduction histidine kinase